MSHRTTTRRRSSASRRGVALACLAALLLRAPHAAADVGIALAVDRAEGARDCPDAAALREKVAERIGHDPFVEKSSNVLEQRFDRRGRQWRASLVYVDAAGEHGVGRTLTADGATCASLADAAAVALVVALDDLAPPRAGASSAAPSAAAPHPELEEPPLPVATTPAAAADAEAKSRARILVGAVAAVADAPAAAVGFRAGLGFERGSWSLDLEGRVDAPSHESSGKVRSALRTATLVPCAHFGVLEGCVTAGGGALVLEGIDVVGPDTVTVFWFALGARVAVTWSFAENFALRPFLDAHAPLTRGRAFVGTEAVYEPAPIAGAAGFDVLVRLP